MKTLDQRTQEVVDALKKDIKMYQDEIKEAAEKLPENPSYVLSWADSLFYAAARIHVYECIVDALTSEKSTVTLEAIKVYATREALTGAEHPKRSTSTAANFMSREIVSAWAEIARKEPW